jgi:hypothetical protein
MEQIKKGMTELPELSILYETAEGELLSKYVEEFALFFDDNAVTVGDVWDEKTEFVWNCFKEDLAEIFSDGFKNERVKLLVNRFPAGTTLPEIINSAFPKQVFIEWLAESTESVRNQ